MLSADRAIPRAVTCQDPVASAGGRRWCRRRLLTLGVIVAYIDRVNLSVAVIDPTFKSFFQLTPSGRGLVTSAFFWSYAALQIPAGWIVDRYGSKIPYALGYLFWSVISAATALATGFSGLVTARLLLARGTVMHPRACAGFGSISANTSCPRHRAVHGRLPVGRLGRPRGLLLQAYGCGRWLSGGPLFAAVALPWLLVCLSDAS